MARGRLHLLLIGGSGFVSGMLTRVAVAEGHRVWAVTGGQRPMTAGGQSTDRLQSGQLGAKRLPHVPDLLHSPPACWKFTANGHRTGWAMGCRGQGEPAPKCCFSLSDEEYEGYS